MEFDFNIKLDLTDEQKEQTKKTFNSEAGEKILEQIINDLTNEFVFNELYWCKLTAKFDGVTKTIEKDNYPF